MSNEPRPITPPHLPRRGRKTDHPRMIGSWKIGRTIGKGATGTVRIARHSKTGQYAAIKIVSKIQLVQSRRSFHNLEDDAERILLGLEREIVVMKLIDHPNIMRLYDVWETSDELYLILEYVEGGELFDYICERGRLPSTEALDYFQQLIGALDYCHRLNIAHRDLKPENLLLDKEKNLKVADFGMAAWQGGDDLLETACGSPHYAAPEIIAGKPYDGTASDIWSSGVILFALLAGKLPFDDEKLDILLEKVRLGRFIMPSDIDPGAQDLLNKMLQKDVSKRITIAEILKHPWYISQSRRNIHCAAPSPDEISQPVSQASDIDMDIFGNLRTLWHNAPDEDIIEALVSNKQTWEKVVYSLLLKYRTKAQENQDEELERARSQRRTERKQKRARREEKKKAQERHIENERPETPAPGPPRPDPPTPRRAAYNQNSGHPSLPPLPAGSTLRPVGQLLCPATDNTTTLGISPSLLSPSLLAPSPLVNSPLSLSMMSPGSPIWEALDVAPPLDVPELHEEHVQHFFQQIIDHLNIMQSRPGAISPLLRNGKVLVADTIAHPTGSNRRPLPVNNHRAPPPTPAGGIVTIHCQAPHIDIDAHQADTHGLGISTAPCESGKENVNRVLKKSSLRKPKDGRAALTDRRVQIVLPPPIERGGPPHRRLSCDSYSSHSPTYSLSEGSSFSAPSAPKRSWFVNLFKFRPVSFTLMSMHDASTTREACQRLLVSFGVRIILTHPEEVNNICFRCQLDEIRDPAGVMAVAKAAKFRVDVHTLDVRQTTESGHTTSLEMVLEKGSLPSFQLICQRLRKEWDLDVTYENNFDTDHLYSPDPSHGSHFSRSPEPIMTRRPSGGRSYF
ncbi:hypothetical protein EW145_g4923 [Phellinidium pouzarii]|uniref:non-specific serine/threonine protein kinase n=1 Tax=Phellinidium pouzarii TaxID=167371 RepID=A0A4S4L3P4_9AGAM|nr:hypothetical protein EW145_g4923 [Phellinidium pouzarii]